MTVSSQALTQNAARRDDWGWPVRRDAAAPAAPAPPQDAARDYQSDAALVQACLDDDETAWQKLVDRYGPLVYSIPRRLGLSEADADDIFQNVFLVVFKRLATLRTHTSLCAWLIKITHRECLHYFRRRPDYAELADEILDVAALLPEEVERWEQRALVREALSRLDPRSQAILQALFFEVVTPSYEEVAQRLGVALGAVGPTRARSLKKLETILTSMGVDWAAG